MINEQCFTRKWIDDVRNRYPLASPQLLEKTLYAFEFLALLAKSKYPFVFKGGTALILILPEINRLSIDVDLVADIPLEALYDTLTGSRFVSMEEDVRAGNVPATHVKFYYESLYPPARNYVLVDILRDYHPYSRLQDVALKRDELFHVDELFKVSLPSANDILGDKLTAFAPNTTGVLYNSKKSLEIIKQLFDVAELVPLASSVEEVLSTFERVRVQQNSYRKSNFTTTEILDDVITTSRLLCQIDLKNFVESSQTTEMRAGMKAIHPYLLSKKFSLPEAKLAASRAAFIASLLKRANITQNLDQLRFTPEKIEQIRSELLIGVLSSFNKLKNTNPEAFYYWWQVSQLETR